MVKSVSFNLADTICYTYSSEEYDRSYFAYIEPCIKYTFPFLPENTSNQLTGSTTNSLQQCNGNRPSIKPLDLSIVPNSRRRTLESPTENNISAKKVRNRPSLSINTKTLSEGPLFFTGLSTHYKCKDDEEEECGYLIPVSAC
ncbi:hypothetical protein G6F56_001331 [Rhizopus delemar]|nr:hypothetical protein G6F56_001331 [Rhizopus delemar]